MHSMLNGCQLPNLHLYVIFNHSGSLCVQDSGYGYRILFLIEFKISNPVTCLRVKAHCCGFLFINNFYIFYARAFKNNSNDK